MCISFSTSESMLILPINLQHEYKTPIQPTQMGLNQALRTFCSSRTAKGTNAKNLRVTKLATEFLPEPSSSCLKMSFAFFQIKKLYYDVRKNARY